MNHVLHVHGNNQSAFLERLLRVTRHRGFNISSMMMQPLGAEDHVHLTLTVCGERPIDKLQKQLQKLIDVRAVEVLTQQSQRATA